METAAFSTGVSIQYPFGRSTANFSSIYHNERVQYPFPFPVDSKTPSERQYRADTETYSVCQELAYHFACEKTRRAVQELLRKSNGTSYSQVLRFFEKYCARDESITEPKGPTRGVSPSGRRLRDPNAPVIFPEFHAFPTAAVITGTDATSSDLWIGPLTHKLRRTFPLCVKVHRDVATARRFVEWLAARIAKMCAAKQREEMWLEGLVDKFDLLPLDQPPVTVGSVGRRVTRHQRAKAHDDTGVDDQEDDKDKDYQSDDSFFDSSSESEVSDDDLDFGARKRKGKKKRRRKKLSSVAYGRGDTSRGWVAMLGELVHDRLQEALTLVRKFHLKEDEMVMQSIACLDEAVTWLQHKIVACRDTAAKLLNVAPESDSNNSASVHIGSSEMALAIMLQRVFLQYTSLLDEWTLDRPTINDRRKSNYYMLKGDDIDTVIQTPQPFLLLCIEQLEAFSQQVLGDFLEIWTHFVQQQQETKASSCSLGFVVGVASATSPALRRLDLTVTNRLELQFFSLVDSRKCFDDVLESLVVKAKLPLALSGEVLRAIASRHHRLPSRRRQARWRLGWECFRCACSWLDVRIDSNVTDLDKQEDVAVTHLALALEGRLGKLHASWKYFDAYRTNREDPAKMLIALREEIVTVFTTRLSLRYCIQLHLVDAEGRGVLEERLRFEYHDHLRNVLQDAGIGENTNTNGTAEASWVHDVGLAFLFYQESASASLSLREWYDSFSSELGEEAKTLTSKKRKAENFSDDPAIKARFVRAVCTLRTGASSRATHLETQSKISSKS
ncbi:Origin recognition complex, subunit 3 [Phytophthora cactorum]|nr:Origin recognition complex, subunit 3 [Phytophthora cactorum]